MASELIVEPIVIKVTELKAETVSPLSYFLEDRKRILKWKVCGDGISIKTRFITNEVRDDPNKKHNLFEFLGEECRRNHRPIFLEWFGEIYYFVGYIPPKVVDLTES